MFSAPFLVTLLDRVKAIVRRVVRPAATRPQAIPADPATTAQRPISPALRGRMQSWLSTRLAALSRLMGRIDAGERPVCARRKMGLRKNAAPGAPASIPPENRLPRGFGWMCAFGPDVREDGAAFAAWLSETEMQTRVLAAPERIAKLVGPILSATGERRPAWFPVAPKRARHQPAVCGVSAGDCDEPETPSRPAGRRIGFGNDFAIAVSCRGRSCRWRSPDQIRR
jgi:hypothetical protein